MRKIITKLVAPILLTLSVVFAGFTFATTFSNPAFAVPGEGNDTMNTTDKPSTDQTDLNTDTNDSPNEDPNNPSGTDSTEDNPSDSTEDNTDGATTEDGSDTDAATTEETPVDVCKQETGGLYWIVCPAISLVSNITDSLYTAINDFLTVDPLEMTNDSPVYQVWQYVRSLTNIIFVIFLIIVIYSQITGLGINNYGIKRVLPRLIITVMLVNLSFYICALLTDVSNIVGTNLRDFFQGIQESITLNGAIGEMPDISLTSILTVILGGGTIAGITIAATGGVGALLWSLVPILIAGLVAIVTGLITIAARQAIITLLVMIAPLAFIAYLLPNTEKWFGRWKEMFTRMLIFYPVFSFLFGASKLAGWAIIASAPNAPTILLGLAVQIFPLFGSWSLMKMSGSVLGTLNAAMRKATMPAQQFASGWATEHADRSRQNYWNNTYSTGSRLRGFLDYRQKLRLLDAQNAKEARENRAATRAYTKASSITGRDELGNTTWERDPNRYTRNAKSASYYATLAGTAQSAYKNTVTAYGRHFGDHNSAAKRLNEASGEAYLDAMAQSFLTANEAQADQEFLLNRYLSAATNQNRNTYQYNRLIKDAAGSLFHNGESSIMGQVIVNSSNIENRRRAEARIVATKFGVPKTQMRGMTFDKAFINDNGYETTADGIPIEDTQYHLIEYDENGKPTGFQRQSWQHYIAVHKTSGKELTKEEYDILSDDERANYRKVRYFDILDDNGDPVQRVFEDDAGYMKELLRDDIAIGDPINRRYLTEIGVAHAEGESTGILRRYHSTISAAMLETRYKEHAAEVTPMITAQANAGYITSIGQYNIANLQSLSVASKAGSFLQNDAYAINDWAKLVSCAFDDDLFAEYFPDADIENYRNVNGVHLDGWRLAYDKNGQPYWQEINHNDPSITLEDKKNCLRHKIIPKAASKLVGMLNRNVSPAVLDSMKPDTLKALRGLLSTLTKIGIDNFDEQRAFENRLQGDMNIFDNPDPSVLKAGVAAAQQRIDQILGRKTDSTDDTDDLTDDGNDTTPPTTPTDGGHSGPAGSGSTPTSNGQQTNPARRPGTKQLANRLERSRRAQQRRNEANNINNILEIVNGYFYAVSDYEVLAAQLLDYFNEVEILQPLVRECEILIDQYRYDDAPDSTEDAIDQIAHANERQQERIEQLHQAIIDLIYTADQNN